MRGYRTVARSALNVTAQCALSAQSKHSFDASHEALANWSTSIYSRQSVVSGRNTRSVLLHLANLGSAAPHLRQCVGDGAA